MKKIKFIQHNQINKMKWDLCMDKSINKSVYGLSWYLDIVAKKWDALIYGDYELIFPITFKNLVPFTPFIKHLYQPMFCQQLGAFSASETMLCDKYIIGDILHFLKKNYWYLHYCFNHSIALNYQEYILKNKLPFNSVVRVNLELNLSADYNRLFEKYNKNTKRNINKDFKYQIQKIEKVSIFFNFFKNHLPRIVNLKKKDYKTIFNIITVAIGKENGKCIGLYDDSNNLLACGFFLVLYDRHILLFNASIRDDSKRNFMTYLIDSYIRKNSCKKEYLDFEGSNIVGVKRFYKGFGAVEKNYLYVQGL
tara:strand:- start:240 stop:1163 length:924 start_codon:yes stop_codon:yes gene_type:complete